jgi:nicotinamide mononucleotide transporter
VQISLVEILGFITGAICVWLVVKEHILNWPIGIANNVFFVVLFFRTKLFGDMALQFVYMALGFLGWYRWVRGGPAHSGVGIRRTPIGAAVTLLVFVVAATPALTAYLRSIRDSAPLLDAITTTLSIAAQYMQTRKYLEHWAVWIVADVIYVGLYVARGLHLTALLYIVFLLMCIQGWREWRTRAEPGDLRNADVSHSVN